jgi:hypothetical protein
MELVVGLMRILFPCAVLLLPVIADTQCTSPFAVECVWTQDALGTEKTIFAPGETIQFAAELSNYQTMAEDHVHKSVGKCHPYREFEGF